MRTNIDQLLLARQLTDHGLHHLHFTQSYSGVPVFTGEYDVTVGSDGSVHMISGKFFPNIELDVKPILSSEQAALLVPKFLNVQNLRQNQSSELVVFPKDGKYILVYKVITLAGDPSQDWLTMVDAKTGEIIYSEDVTVHTDGSGYVYPKDPVNSNLTTVTLPRLAGTGNYLEGTYVRALNEDQTRAYSSNAQFFYTPPSYTQFDNTHFDEVNLYYHVDKFATHLANDVGFTGLGRAIEATAHVGSNYNNAYYDINGTHNLFFGDGDRIRFYDFAKKEDIIYHEFQHAISHYIGLQYSGETAGLHEGFSDYFSASYTQDPHIGEWVTIATNTGDLRIVANDVGYFKYSNYNNVQYAQNTVDGGYLNPAGSPHANGMIWSGAVWDLRNQLGSSVMDFLALKGIYYRNGYATFLQEREGIIQADIDYYGGAHVNTIMNIMAARGIGQPAIPPIIAYFYQDPDPLYNGGTGYVYAQISQGINVTYSWYASYSPSNMTFHFTPQGNRCQVDYYIPFQTLPTINFTCVASNAGGTDVKSYQLHCALYGYGPASLAFVKNGTLIDENPVLVSSVDNPGVDVTDYYLINKEITPENQTDGKAGNAVNFSIHERDQTKGHTNLDQVELWEVKANPNEFIAITEDGEVISYKKLVTPNHIILNDSLDVTNILADKDNLKLTVKKGDRIRIKHPGNAEELYSVFYAQLYNSEELLAANNNSSDLYYFRPQSSAVCKKLKVIPSGDIEIAFGKDLVLDYFALIKNEKTAKAEKLNLLSAEHSKAGEAASLFAAADKQYGEILPGEEIKFKYETKPNSNNDNTAYILKTVGKYKKASLQKEGNLETISVLPKETTLYDNYPNPFNPSTTINYQLPENGFVTIKVYDVLGKEVATLVNKNKSAGYYNVSFDASKLTSGVYIYTINVNGFAQSKKMLLMK
ncbi:MAG: M36 family metallopeptidase [Bacteroidetes bacterium]|nr:M36 family metallopeptidase [Bacteroidota bacterium]